MRHFLIATTLTLVLFACEQKPAEMTDGTTVAKDSNTDDKWQKGIFKDDFIDGLPIYTYLQDEENDSLVMAYYKGKFIPQVGDEKTEELLKILIEEKGSLRPFYYRCFTNICGKADEELAKSLGSQCQQMLISNPLYCIKKLSEGEPDFFTGFISHDIYENSDWESIVSELDKSIRAQIPEDKKVLVTELDHLIQGIRNDVKHLRKHESH